MPKVLRSRADSTPWSSLLAGAVLGAAASWLLTRAPRRAALDGARAWADALQGLTAARGFGRARPTADLGALNDLVAENAGAEALEVRSLGAGIVELVGTAGEELDVRALLDAVAAQEGVSVVVNRVWTPHSVRPAQALDPAPPETTP